MAHEQMFQHALEGGVLLAVEFRILEKRDVAGPASLLDSAERANRIAL
jgi:hypothetical protein